MITTFRGDFWRQASIKQTHFYTQTFYKKTAVVDALRKPASKVAKPAQIQPKS